MADLPNPYLSDNPDQSVPAYLDAQRKMMLAQMLMQNMQHANQTPEDWNRMRLVPKMNPLSGIAGVVGGYLAGKGYNNAQKATMNYYGTLMGQPQSAPSAPQGAPAGGMAPQGAQPPQSVAPSAAQQSNGFADGPAMRRLKVFAPEKYVEVAAQRENGTPEWQNALRASGGNPGAAQELLAGKMRKEGTIDLREGGVAFGPDGKPIAAVPKEGQIPLFDASGNIVAYKTATGYVENIAELAGAKTAAETANKYNVLPGPGGGSVVVGGPHTGMDVPAPKSYFSPTAPAGGSSAPTAVPIAPSGMWASVPKLSIPSGVGTNPIVAGHIENAKEIAKELSTNFGNEADTATQKMNNNNESLAALPNAETGPLSHWLTENRAKMLELGIPVPKSGSVTPTFVLNKNLLNSALQGAKQIYGARMTSNEVMLQKNEAAPSTLTTAAAIKSLIMQDNAKNAYFVKRANDFSKYVSMGGDPTQFKAWYAQNRPLIQFARQYATDPRALALLKEHPEQLSAFKAKYGFTPSDD